jgi:hypothetical protein
VKNPSPYLAVPYSQVPREDPNYTGGAKLLDYGDRTWQNIVENHNTTDSWNRTQNDVLNLSELGNVNFGTGGDSAPPSDTTLVVLAVLGVGLAVVALFWTKD